MKLLFNFNISQKLLLHTVLIVTVFLSSCGTGKKIKGRETSFKSERSRQVSVDRKTSEARSEGKSKRASADEREEKGGEAGSKKITRVISEARSFIGTPYKYGGTTRSGMDCSGLLLNSFKVIRLDLPRSSQEQSKIGSEVKLKDLEPGDLVFFATGKNKNKVTHVGLVTKKLGKNDVKFIHASSSLGVVETNISGEYYQQRFLGARRVID